MSEGSSARHAGLLPTVLALAIGAVGGAVFMYLRLPLPWMIGAAAFTTATALAGLTIRLPRAVHGAMIGVLGVMLGSAFTPEAVEHFLKWTASLAGLAVYVIAVGAVSLLFLRRHMRFGPVTAYFSSAPGGFSDMVILGAAMGGDVRIISLMHSTRIFLVALVIPFWFRLFQGYVPTGYGVPFPLIAGVSLPDFVVLLLSGFAGWLIARLIRLPAPIFTGPMLLSAIVHLSGVTAAKPPGVLVITAQVVIGASIGCRFTGYPLRRMASVMGVGAVTTFGMLVVGAACAAALAQLTGLPFTALLLSFSPGGLVEMSLIGLAMNIDTALVSAHHLWRIFVVVMVAPIAFQVLSRRFGFARSEDGGGDGPNAGGGLH